MGKTQYPQKFRDEWLVHSSFKDWLIKIEDDTSIVLMSILQD